MAEPKNTLNHSPKPIAQVYKIIGEPTRNKIISTLNIRGAMTFKSICESLDLDRGRTAYHLKLLENAGLIENYYDKIKGTRGHSFYTLTALGRWLLNRDIQLNMESKYYGPKPKLSRETTKDSEIERAPDLVEAKQEIIKDSLKESRKENIPAIADEPFVIKKDIRIKNNNYKVILKQ
jgi:DNA-binding transcriptional ArsR family regulator